MFNITLEVDGVPHPLPLHPTVTVLPSTATIGARTSIAAATAATTTTTWAECGRIFGSGGGNCAAVGLVEDGAGVAECEAACLEHPTCTAFNLRLVVLTWA